MDREAERDFLPAMREAIDEGIFDLAEALYAAMCEVDAYPDGAEVRYFGPIGEGTFYAAGSIETVRWFPATDPGLARELLAAEFGEAAVAGLRD